MKKTLITAAILILSGSAFAQYVGPSTQAAPVTTVQQLLKNGKDNQYVTVEGTIVRQIKRNHYLFADKTGQINVEIKQKYMPAVRIGDKTRLSLTGKLDKDWNDPIELEVKEVRILP